MTCESPLTRQRAKRRLLDGEPETPVKTRRHDRACAASELVAWKATQAEVLLDQGVSVGDSYPLVGRQRECDVLDEFMKSCFSGKPSQASCLYLSGGPGTGKTSSARGAARAWRAQCPKTRVVEINCMEQLQPNSVAGLYLRLIEVCNTAAGEQTQTSVTAKSPMSSLMSAACSSLQCLGGPVILIIDEVDQLVKKASTGENSLDHLCNLVLQPGAPPLAILMIANAVDLLIRACKQGQGCESLLFEPYSADQLRSIVKSKFAVAGEEGQLAEKALGRAGIELSIRKVAKHSGDCRHIVRLCEDGFAEASRQKESAEGGQEQDAKKKVLQSDNDPLAEVKHFPIGHQILLGTLSQSEKQDVTFTDLFQRYKAMLSRLKQPAASKMQANAAVSAMEQRGLLHLRKRRASRGANPDHVVELVVSRKSLREVLCEASPLLKHCFSDGP